MEWGTIFVVNLNPELIAGKISQVSCGHKFQDGVYNITQVVRTFGWMLSRKYENPINFKLLPYNQHFMIYHQICHAIMPIWLCFRSLQNAVNKNQIGTRERANWGKLLSMLFRD